MSVSRRKFLQAGAVVSAALVLKPASLALGQKFVSSTHSTSSSAPHFYSREMFEPYVGDVFRVRAGKQIVELKLVALESVAPASRGITTGRTARTDCFSIQFHSSKPLPRTAGTRNLSHDKLGTFDLFMNASRDGSKFTHTAIVNHLA
jgi:uncharacterized protein DUF6916